MEKIAVIGVGRLGLCLALNLERSGYEVLGVDVKEEYVNAINSKKINSSEPQVSELLSASKYFTATNNLYEIFERGITTLFVVLPTPSLPDGRFNHQWIDTVAQNLIRKGKQEKQHYLIINSTTMPGYCDQLAKRLSKFNYTVIYNPEFIAQGSIINDQRRPDQVLIGEENTEAGDKVESIYKRICENAPVFCRMSRISAEITKLATNCFLTTKIAFANAIGDLALKTGAEPEKVLQAIGADSRIGQKYFKYGFGYGGPCFPRDNRAFNNFATENNYDMLIGNATDKANSLHANFLLEEKLKRYENKQVVELDTVTYKKGTDIIEESQQLELAIDLAKAGKTVVIKESQVVLNQLKATYGNLFTYKLNGD